VVVPAVVGQPLARAERAVRGAGLRVDADAVREEESSAGPPGTVLAQDPSPGRRVSAREPVRLTVARAPAPVDLSAAAEVRDVGPEGTIPATAAVTAMEVAFAGAGRPVRLSERYLYEKARRHDETAGGEGTYLTAIVYIAEQFGVAPRAMWPYAPGRRGLPPGASWARLDSAAADHRARFHRVGGGVAGIHGELRRGRPVVAAVAMVPEFTAAGASRTGRVARDSAAGRDFLGTGAITFVGFDPAAGVLRFANSWGPGWGDRGYGTMSPATARALVDTLAMWAVEAAPPR
jgi:hypothetical protein